MKKIALVVDAPNWAFDIGAKVIKKELSDEYVIDIFVSKNEKYNDDLFEILEDVKEYDYIHFFWRKNLLQFDTDGFKQKVKEKYESVETYIDKLKGKLSTGVYDHLFLDDENIKLYANVFNKYVNKYVVCSNKLYEIYSSISEYKKPYCVIRDTYDGELMRPYNLERFEDFERPLVIGWVGNSEWNKKSGMDFKGLNTILNPVMEELLQEGYKIEKKYADRVTRFRGNDEMPEYYSEIDVYICVSMCEGTPRPVLEAMSCGVPIITTDVGIAKEVLGDIEKNFILGDREDGNNDEYIIKELKNKIIYLYNNRQKLKELSEENLQLANRYNAKTVQKQYRELFE